MIIEEDAYLAHYGVLRRSGRYPWGSGEDGANHDEAAMFGWLGEVAKLRKQGVPDVKIAEGFGMSTTQLRASASIAKSAQKQSRITEAQRLSDKGMSTSAIGRQMNLPESSVRALLAPGAKDKADALTATSNMLKDQVAKKGMIDIGSGVETQLNMSQTKLSTAVEVLRQEGYEVHTVPVQTAPGMKTYVKVLAPPGTTWGDVARNKDKIQPIQARTVDSGRTWSNIHPPISIHEDRVDVKYKEDGGAEADGVIFVRRGVKDVSLGNSNYAQVRVLVGDSHYLKGMAMYHDDMPPGKDLVFNTNKTKAQAPTKKDAMKTLSSDPDNPFGAMISSQVTERDHTGKEHVTSVMNKVNEEGDWTKWSKSISAQVLSKQPPSLAKNQLDMVYERRTNEYKEIMSLTNPTVRKKLLETFGDETESSANHLKAAALPRQGWHVILPLSTMKPNEIYAPNYNDGETVALIRYPHGGTFEIPELTVNNRHREGRSLIGPNSPDAVGIHHSVAERLSGADFDGDTVIVIPNNNKKVVTSPALKGLKNFDPKVTYKGYEGMPVLSAKRKQQEMGDVSNLITDMTIKGAPPEEIVRAVRHSMVVIDAEKHKLNYKESARVNGIADLKSKYQGGPRAGATTLISRAGSTARVPERKPRTAAKGGAIDKATGARAYEVTGRSYKNKQGVVVPSITKSTKLAEAKSAHDLSSGTTIEKLYADHSDKMKVLANKARLESVRTPHLVYSPSARKHYAAEVKSLNSKLLVAKTNRPFERQAQLLAASQVRLKRQTKPDMDPAELRKVKAMAINEARLRVGAKKVKIEFTPREWEAIQHGAIRHSKLEEMLNNADIDQVIELAKPRQQKALTATMSRRATAMFASGYTRSEVAKQLGVSTSTLDAAVKGG